MPMNQGINLLNPNYVPVVKDQKTYYGGSQMWFSDNKKLSTDRLLHNYGCGTIATADLFLYLVLQNQAESNSLTDIAIGKADTIDYQDYMSYVRKIHSLYTKTKPIIAVLGPKVASAIHRYSKTYQLGLKASWKMNLSYYDMLALMEEMLSKDLPVIFSIGPNTPNLWGKKGIRFFTHKELENKKYEYQVARTEINGHYVTVTGIIKDEIKKKLMLQISSWGKMFYIDYEEYRDYVDHFSGTITSSMVYIRKP